MELITIRIIFGLNRYQNKLAPSKIRFYYLDIFAFDCKKHLFEIIMNLYDIKSIEKGDGSADVKLVLNLDHEVYKGHFPGKPILPGALQVEMIKDIFALVLDREIRLDSAKNIKYLGFIDPENTKDLFLKFQFKLIDDAWSLRATISDIQEEKPQIFTKFSGAFIEG